MTGSKGLLLCSTAMLLTFGAASQAATPVTDDTAPALVANSYADLLAPIANATALLEADNLARAQAAPEPRVQLAQYHHHHHHYRRYRHHHHHHHSNFPWAVIPGFGAPPPAYYRPHCYWTWGDPYWNGYRWVRRHIRVCD
ncbi:MAG: hypothetical protein WCA36_04670 [Pseudolabrys sp.]